jgi:hypothetical protein
MRNSLTVGNKEILAEGIKKLPVEKRRVIADLILEACMAINSVECELINTSLEMDGLFDGENHPTLWCQLYELKKMFSNV